MSSERNPPASGTNVIGGTWRTGALIKWLSTPMEESPSLADTHQEGNTVRQHMGAMGVAGRYGGLAPAGESREYFDYTGNRPTYSKVSVRDASALKRYIAYGTAADQVSALRRQALVAVNGLGLWFAE